MQRFNYTYGENVASQYPFVEISVERITPEVAQRMLRTNVRNRDPKREPLRKAMENGEWHLNGASIVFDSRGVLLDGQNRLMACVSSGISFDTIVVRGLPQRAQDTMDTGAKRTIADNLKIKGMKNAGNVASIGAALYRKDQAGIEGALVKQAGDRYTVSSVLRFIEENDDGRIEPIIRPSMYMSKRFPGLTMTVPALVLDELMTIGADDDDVTEFVDQIMGRSVPCRPVMLLVDRLQKNAASKTGRLNRRTVAALLIKTWNAYATGDDGGANLRFRQGGAHPEEFPTLVAGSLA